MILPKDVSLSLLFINKPSKKLWKSVLRSLMIDLAKKFDNKPEIVYMMKKKIIFIKLDTIPQGFFH